METSHWNGTLSSWPRTLFLFKKKEVTGTSGITNNQQQRNSSYVSITLTVVQKEELVMETPRSNQKKKTHREVFTCSDKMVFLMYQSRVQVAEVSWKHFVPIYLLPEVTCGSHDQLTSSENDTLCLDQREKKVTKILTVSKANFRLVCFTLDNKKNPQIAILLS